MDGKADIIETNLREFENVTFLTDVRWVHSLGFPGPNSVTGAEDLIYTSGQHFVRSSPI